MNIAGASLLEFQEEFSFENLRKRMSARLEKVRRINNPDNGENKRPLVKEDQNQRD